MRCSLRLNNDLPVDEFVDLCRLAEFHGFDQVWVSHDLFLRSAPVLVTAAALATERISLGIGILNPYSQHAAEIAMTAATLQEVSGGRFLLGLGAGAEEFLGWAGIARPKPLGHVREAVHAVRALLSGGRPADDGQAGPRWRAEGHLRTPAAPTPVYVGGMSPKMLGLAGQVADGVLPLLYPPEHYPVAAAQVHDGARATGRRPDEVDVAACIWVSVDPDADRARRALARKVAYYGASFAPYLLERANLSVADFAQVSAALNDGDSDRASDLVTPDMLRLGIAGTAQDVFERCRWLTAAGARHVSFGPPLGPDVLDAVEQLGSVVLPGLRAQATP